MPINQRRPDHGGYLQSGNYAKSNITSWIIAIVMLIGLPLTGIILSGGDVANYLQFPPFTRRIVHAPFSWRAFAVYATLDLALILFVASLLVSGLRSRASEGSTIHRKPFPVWGWIGLAVMAIGWLLAWTRFEWFALFQSHTFCLPWIGYIMFINALSVQRSGGSLLTHIKWRFAALALGSAVFWWFFEYLNRFVENWYYVGLENMSPAAYTLFASLAFATVLPAVLSTQYWLLTFAPFRGGLQATPLPLPVNYHLLGLIIVLIAGTGLAFIGVWPDQLFSLIWLAPLLIVTGLQALIGRPTLFSPVLSGDWRGVVSAATAALICGFFWELWNIGSLARWEYAIPYVNRYHLFAMPILGYGGYLPFGLECMLIGGIILGSKPPFNFNIPNQS